MTATVVRWRRLDNPTVDAAGRGADSGDRWLSGTVRSHPEIQRGVQRRECAPLRAVFELEMISERSQDGAPRPLKTGQERGRSAP
jgi:hypothetical protein